MYLTRTSYMHSACGALRLRSSLTASSRQPVGCHPGPGTCRAKGLPRLPILGRHRPARGARYRAVRAQGVQALHVAELLHYLVDLLHIVHAAVSRAHSSSVEDITLIRASTV